MLKDVVFTRKGVLRIKARILVVDDSPQFVEMYAAMLEREGYIVSKAFDGVDALEKIEIEKPDLISLDVIMPRMDGFEVCRRIRANPATAHLSVIMVSTLSDDASRIKGFEVGANDYMTIPCQSHVILDRISSLLSREAHLPG